MKTSDAITYNSLVRFSHGMKTSKDRTMVIALLTAIRALIVGDYSKNGFDKALEQEVNWKYFHTILQSWSQIKHSTNPKRRLVELASARHVASFH